MGMLVALIAAEVLAQPRGRPVPPAPVPDADTPAQNVPRGENFSAKPAAQLFASDCTGAGCHRGPQGLAKRGAFGLTSFLRQHYTNSQQSAAALAAYLAGVPGDARPAPRQKAEPRPDATPKGDQKKSATAARPPRGKQATVEPAPAPPPEPPAAPPPPPPPKVFDIFD